MFRKLAQQLKTMNNKNSYAPMSKPFNAPNSFVFINRLSKHALEQYEKKITVKKFTKLALSDPDDFSHDDLVDKLCETQEVSDLLSEKNIDDLVNNENFLKDLGI